MLTERIFQFKNLLSAQTFKVMPVRSGHQTCTRNKCKGSKPAYTKGIQKQDGTYVQTGTLLVIQRTMKMHPGMNVGVARNGSLFSMANGTVRISCEKFNPDYSHSFVKGNYEGREDQTIYKKYANVIPDPQHNRFKLVKVV